ncbi:MAG: hypothetical protein F9K46_04615 [Anaerolineae bacterium]|nr:MAG: hypothetical protein F9K46_04615 [Anaerolineae bacterium]
MAYRKMMLVSFICLMLGSIFSARGVVAQSEDENLPPVAWLELNQEGSTLRLFQSETGVSIVSNEDIRCAAFSPQQTHIAYLTSNALAVMRLSDHATIINMLVDGLTRPDLHLFIGGRACPIWLDETSLVFSTVDFAEPYGMPAYNLFHLAINTAELTEVLAFGKSGAIAPSPNRQYLVILKPGEYSDPDRPGEITVIDSTTFQPVNDGFEFPAVATAAEYLWVPTIFWKADSTGFVFGLPDQDLVYSIEQTSPSSICYMTPDDQPTRCQEYAFEFWGMPIFNDQLTRVAYAQRSGSGVNEGSHLVYGEFSLESPQELSEIAFSTTSGMPILWLDEDNLLFKEYALPDLNVVNLTTGKVKLWPDESSEVKQPIVALQPLKDGLYVLAVGDYREPHTIGFYNATDGAFTKLAEVDSLSTIVFADR